MSDQTLDRLTARIETLERQNRWLKRGAVALVAMGLCGGAAAQTLKPVPIVGDRVFAGGRDGSHPGDARELPGARVGHIPCSPSSTTRASHGCGSASGCAARLLEIIDENGKARDYFGPPGVRPATQ